MEVDDNDDIFGGDVMAVSSMAKALIEGEEMVFRAMYLVTGLCSMVTAPFEMALRPSFGTMYLNPVTWFFNLLVIHVWFLTGVAFEMAKTRLGQHGLIGVEMFVPVYYLLSAYHAWRLWDLVEHPHKEADSEADGRTLRLVQEMPGGRTWRRARVVLEPALLLMIGVGLYIVRVFNATALAFFVTGAIALSFKCGLRWCMGWYLFRKQLDGKNRSQIIGSIHKGGNPPPTLGGIPIPEQPGFKEAA